MLDVSNLILGLTKTAFDAPNRCVFEDSILSVCLEALIFVLFCLTFLPLFPYIVGEAKKRWGLNHMYRALTTIEHPKNSFIFIIR